MHVIVYAKSGTPEGYRLEKLIFHVAREWNVEFFHNLDVLAKRLRHARTLGLVSVIMVTRISSTNKPPHLLNKVGGEFRHGGN